MTAQSPGCSKHLTLTLTLSRESVVKDQVVQENEPLHLVNQITSRISEETKGRQHTAKDSLFA